MSDTESQLSNKSVKAKKTQEITLEEKLGFKPSGANNYFCSIYDHEKKDRTMLFDGAIPLHEFTPLLPDFLEQYINKCTKDESYNITVITAEDPNISLATFSGALTGEEKYTNTKTQFDKITLILDNIYGVFIKNENKQLKEYRKYVKFSDLVKSYETYKTIKPKIYQLIESLKN